jgi:sugar phosphate isomerase/epimerase
MNMKTNRDIKLGVSLYSYQDNYYFKKHDLDGCLAAAAGAGAEGVEVFADTMIPEWPYVSDEFVNKWFGMLKRYDLEPVCMDHFSDRRMWKNRDLTDDEMFERGVLYLKTAHRLGCKSVRMLHNEHCGLGISPVPLTTAAIVERLLPIARDLDIMMALECHAPTTIDDPVHEPYLEAAYKLGIPNVGLQADFSSYEYCMSSADVAFCIYSGCTDSVINFIRDKQREAYFAGKQFFMEDIMPDIKKMKLSDADRDYIDMSQPAFRGTSLKYFGVVQRNGEYVPVDWAKAYKTLEEYASKLVYVHGKFYDIDKDGQVDSMDYPRLLKALQKGGYKGYINSEFEGNRRMNVLGWVDEISLVNKQHRLMRKCLGYE